LGPVNRVSPPAPEGGSSNGGGDRRGGAGTPRNASAVLAPGHHTFSCWGRSSKGGWRGRFDGGCGCFGFCYVVGWLRDMWHGVASFSFQKKKLCGKKKKKKKEKKSRGDVCYCAPQKHVPGKVVLNLGTVGGDWVEKFAVVKMGGKINFDQSGRSRYPRAKSLDFNKISTPPDYRSREGER